MTKVVVLARYEIERHRNLQMRLKAMAVKLRAE